MNRKHLRSLLGCVLPLSLPLFVGCIDEFDELDELELDQSRSLPVPTMNRISTGNLASLVIRSDGTVSSSGDNTYGQLGDGTTTDRTSPGPVDGLSNVIAVSAGDSNYSLALTGDGQLWSWGSHLWGQLGTGSNSDQLEPVHIDSLSHVTAMTAEYLHGLAVTSDGVTPDGTVWAWGINTYGQLGDESDAERKTPVQVHDLSGVTAVAGGHGHSLALKEDGTVWAWGRNTEGQLGLGNQNYANQFEPVQVSGLSNVVAVAGSMRYSLALKDDGTVFVWGDPTYYSQKCPSALDRTVPQQVTGLTNIVAIEAGEKNILVLKDDGTVLGWGRNSNGELGNSNIIEQCTPVEASGLSGVTALSVGKGHSLAQTSNGMVFGFGSNSQGQLGDGIDTITKRTTPVPTTFNGGADCSECASWPMPNPAATGLPHPSSYTTEAEIVVDDVTGLHWQRIAGCSTGCTQADANAYCESLTLASSSDWRLPTRIELVSIVDDTEHMPAVDPDAFPATVNAYFWTSSAMGFFPDNAFRIGGSEGDTAYGMVSGLGAARCVHEPTNALASDYEIEADGTPTGTVMDTGTWLTWQQQVSAQTYTWSDALSTCTNNTAGLPGSGWRLPSMKELQTLVDDSHWSPAIDPNVFPNTPFDVAYWTSTPVAWDAGNAWFVQFELGTANKTTATTTMLHVRCVR